MKILIETNKLNTLKNLLITALSIFFIFPVLAQEIPVRPIIEIPVKAERERREISTLDKDQIKGERELPILDQVMIGRIKDIVKPVTEQIEKQINEDETYQVYLKDIEVLNSTTSFEEKISLTEKIKEKYSDYFTKVWAEANVDEISYQLKIRQVFPEGLAALIKFEPFLVFTLNASIVTYTPPTEPPPPTEPLAPNKCLDICSMAAGEITGRGGLLQGQGGSYGNCFLRIHAGSGVFGANYLVGTLKNNITIPGTFPADSRKLRVIKNYELMQEATSFAVLGGGYAETRATTFKTDEYMLVYSPVVFGMHAFKVKTISENYLLEKKDVAKSFFRTSAETFSAFVTGNWCQSNFFAIRWSICEE